MSTIYTKSGRITLLNLWTGEKRVVFDALLPEQYNWMEDTWDLDRALFESEPLWSEDSQRVILVSGHTGQIGLYRYDLPTRELTLLAQGPHHLAWPQWSPDEQYLLYHDISAFGTGAGPTGGALWAVRSDGTGSPRRLSQTDDHYEQISGWIDERHVATYKIAFARPLWDLSSVDLQTGDRTPTFIQDPATRPCWRYDPKTAELTMKLQRQTNIGIYCNAILSPDGRFAAVDYDGSIEQSNNKFLLLDLQTGTVTTLDEKESIHWAVFDQAWSPTGDLLLWVTPLGKSTASGNDHYGLWGVRVKEKRPFLIAEQIKLGEKWAWITHHP
ncbi:MAG: hypothetical protein KF832_27640 [Caldilineaceae bacterium]|nr:hypothetical protein [Caldilineaceae bacterium]